MSAQSPQSSPTPASPRWLRVSRRCPCPVCGRPDWCGLAADGGAAACMRVESDSVRRLRNGAWLHRLGEPGGGGAGRPAAERLADLTRQRPHDDADPRKLGRLMDRYRAAVTPARLDGLAAALGLSSRRPLDDLGVGWSAFHPGHAFPARDGQGRLVGIQIRRGDGSKRLVRGSRQGLFLPWNLRRRPADGPLVACEGASDTAACLDLADRHQHDEHLAAPPWRAAGRPNWACGGDELLALVRSLHPNGDARVVVMADAEASGVGRRGARELADLLRPHCRAVRVLLPAAPAKDLRERVAAGLSPAAFAAAVA